MNTGIHAIGEVGAGQKARDDFELKHYHRVSDDVSVPINYDAAARFAALSAAIAIEIANSPVRPYWKPGNFFGDIFGKDTAKRLVEKSK